MSGAHSKHTESEPRRLRLIALLVIAPIALVTLGAMIWLWPQGDFRTGTESSLVEIGGRVSAIQPKACDQELPGDVNGCGTATVQLETGQQVEAQLPNGPGAPKIVDGDSVVVVRAEIPDNPYAIVDHQRASGLWILAAAFAAALIAFGRLRGLTALAGLAVTFAILLLFVVPAILDGQSPLLIAIVGSSAIMVTVLYLTHGFSMATTVAVLGTSASFILTGLLSALAVSALHLTGVTDDTSMAVDLSHQIDMQGLLLAGIIIGSLGVLDDVTVTQAVTVSELSHANPEYGLGQLYRAGSRVGRSHIASVVNTIVLAYAGASMPLLILTVANNASIGEMLTTQFISQEIVRSAVATFGLMAAVPITTGLAALAFRHREATASSHEVA